MSEKITGSWPGGPRREGPTQEGARAPRIKRVEDIEAAAAARRIRSARKHRQRRAWIGLAFTLVFAGGIGWALGLRSHTSVEEIHATQTAQQEQDATISSQVNRVMLELWRMEEVEAARNGGRVR